ncbi:type IV pilin protein [Halomonas sp. LS-001]
MSSLLPPACRIKHSQRGFTLIELLIVVAIISLLAAIGYPRYTAYVERSLRSDAHSGLLQAASEMERCYSREYSYADCAPYTGESSDGKESPDGNYTIIGSSDGSGYTLTATLDDSSRSDGCNNEEGGSQGITLNALGERGPEACW